MVLGFLPSRMGEFTKGSGKMGNNMEEADTKRRIWLKKGFGKTEREYGGLETNKILRQGLQKNQYDQQCDVNYSPIEIFAYFFCVW